MKSLHRRINELEDMEKASGKSSELSPEGEWGLDNHRKHGGYPTYLRGTGESTALTEMSQWKTLQEQWQEIAKAKPFGCLILLLDSTMINSRSI